MVLEMAVSLTKVLDHGSLHGPPDGPLEYH